MGTPCEHCYFFPFSLFHLRMTLFLRPPSELSVPIFRYIPDIADLYFHPPLTHAAPITTNSAWKPAFLSVADKSNYAERRDVLTTKVSMPCFHVPASVLTSHTRIPYIHILCLAEKGQAQCNLRLLIRSFLHFLLENFSTRSHHPANPILPSLTHQSHSQTQIRRSHGKRTRLFHRKTRPMD